MIAPKPMMKVVAQNTDLRGSLALPTVKKRMRFKVASTLTALANLSGGEASAAPPGLIRFPVDCLAGPWSRNAGGRAIQKNTQSLELRI
jgi:hypothetical protein